ncbi:MAG: EAL domain-containing protein [Alphaproteobacteria bacterium]|nr:MAG: EAL domain-containing protein [Alphaproteobacteria bacterium]
MSVSPQKKPDDNVIDFGVFRRPMAGTAGQSFAQYLTFKNVVIALGVATFLIFLGSVASARIAFLFAALLGLLGLLLVEMTSRRRWEAELVGQLQRMSGDYERLVRETARNRNDMMLLKRNLADAGAAARSHGKTPGDDLEQRMVRTLADQLSRLGDAAVAEVPEEALSAFETGVIDADSPLMSATQETIGRMATDEQVLQLLNAAVRQDRIDLFLQPIMALPQRKLRFYEMFSRIRIKPDVYLPAERYIEVAMSQDLVPAIDNLLLLRGLQLIREVQDDSGGAFFCNITSVTLNDPKFMGDLVEFIARNRGMAPRLVFELGQRDLATMSPDALPILEGLSRLGCRFSMDQVRSLSFDFAHMEARHIRFIKADAELVLREMKERGGMARLKRLKAELDTNGIDFIVTRIESERQLVELLDLGIDYGQGFLFGKPVPGKLSQPGKA